MLRTKSISPLTITGRIISVQGCSILATLPEASLGDLCWVTCPSGVPIKGQVIAFQNSLFSLALFEEPLGIYPGTIVRTQRCPLSIPVGDALLGRVINPLGYPIDLNGSPLRYHTQRPITCKAPPAATRPVISHALTSGIKAIDGFCTLGKGQRVAICSSAGVGKSTLLGAIAKTASVDVIVVALVGERSREVKEFIDETLGEAGMHRCVVVVATSDDSSLLRQTAPYSATAIAEFFRDQGKDVLLIVDSLTRMARAIRETSIGAGELPVRHGYTNSVYTQLPRLLERAGTSAKGSITAIYTVLTNQEEDIDPLADEIKSLLDGHIVLRHDLASMGILPAIDITSSISRLFERFHSAQHITTARYLKHAIRRLWKERELIMMGGAPDQELKSILEHQNVLVNLIKQDNNVTSSIEHVRQDMLMASSLLKQS